MRPTISAKSTFMSMVTNGKFLSLLRPWHIIADTERMQLTTKRRNWYLFNYDETTHAFKSVRTVKIDRHMFGSHLTIKVYAGEAIARYISKKKAKEIWDLLLDNDWNRNDNDTVEYVN